MKALLLCFAVMACGGAAGDPPLAFGAPTGLVATVSGGYVNLRWDRVPGAALYRILRAEAEAGPYEVVNFAQGSRSVTNRDQTVTVGVVYWYEVAAVDAAGLEAYSQPVSVTP